MIFYNGKFFTTFVARGWVKSEFQDILFSTLYPIKALHYPLPQFQLIYNLELKEKNSILDRDLNSGL